MFSYLTMLLAQQSMHHWHIFLGPLVLKSRFLNFLKFTEDRDRTVSRRSKPNSRTTLIGEQPNPWNLLQLQDVMNRHRGAKRSRRYELSRIISLLSLAYLLSIGDDLSIQNHRITMTDFKVSVWLVNLTVKQAYAIALFKKYETFLSLPLYTSVTF